MNWTQLFRRFKIPTPRHIIAGAVDWIVTKGQWYALSFVCHALLLLCLTLVGHYVVPQVGTNAPLFEPAEMQPEVDTELVHYNLNDPPLLPKELDPETLLEPAPAQVPGPPIEVGLGGDPIDLGPLGSETGIGEWPAIAVLPRVEGGPGNGNPPGPDGPFRPGGDFAGRGPGRIPRGGTRDTERSVAAALNWIARHQNPDGSWSIDYRHKCKDPTCTGGGSAKSDAAATALALLPFLATGQTHKAPLKGPYRKVVFNGVAWLVRNQQATGDLSVGADQTMYSHGLATIALCEAYGLSQDKRLGPPAQASLRFIEAGQDPQTGGWWYKWKQRGGDTSVFGWQLMGLKSGRMAQLAVNDKSFAGGQAWLSRVAKGPAKGQFSYTVERDASPTMTAVGLLCRQYLGMQREDPAMAAGIDYLMANPPRKQARDFYYWYYATQVMHNVPGADWDTWNRQMRRTLIESQISDGCAEGSWDPQQPTPDAWGEPGGRLMVTSLAALTLEVYYRYLPLYQMGGSRR